MGYTSVSRYSTFSTSPTTINLLGYWGLIENRETSPFLSDFYRNRSLFDRDGAKNKLAQFLEAQAQCRFSSCNSIVL